MEFNQPSQIVKDLTFGNKANSKIMKGVKAALKNGGPTESFLSKNNSATKGHIVPIKITKS